MFFLLHRFASHFSSPLSVFLWQRGCFDAFLSAQALFLPDENLDQFSPAAPSTSSDTPPGGSTACLNDKNRRERRERRQKSPFPLFAPVQNPLLAAGRAVSLRLPIRHRFNDGGLVAP
jgi:hypothetical protein